MTWYQKPVRADDTSFATYDHFGGVFVFVRKEIPHVPLGDINWGIADDWPAAPFGLAHHKIEPEMVTPSSGRVAVQVNLAFRPDCTDVGRNVGLINNFAINLDFTNNPISDLKEFRRNLLQIPSLVVKA